ncbi:MAG: radical SAM protein [Desulfurococcaceae archaeon]
MKIFTPRWSYQAISITGDWCALNCSYCKGRYLRGMIPVDVRNISDTLIEMWKNGVKGVLISGGFNKDGRLPIEPYLDGLHEIKRKTDLFISMHSGLIRDKDLLIHLSKVINLVDYEYLWSMEMIQFVKNLKATREIFKESFELAREVGLDIVPHIYAWHPWVSREELRDEIEYFNSVGLERVILLVYIPLRPEREGIESKNVLDNVRYIRERFHGEVYMGCMRPWFIKRSIDKALMEENLVDRIVNPYPELLRDKPKGVYDACCSIPRDMLVRFLIRNDPNSHY